MSARIRTQNSFSFKYGKVSFDAKMPAGDWIWPAVWMLPKHNVYGQWPASGEIDILESRGNSIYNKCVASTLHWGPIFELNQYEQTSEEICLDSGSFADDFHKFELEWTENYIQTKVDGEVLLSVSPASTMWEQGDFPSWVYNPGWSSKMAPFDQEFFLIINVAIGGTNGFFPDNAGDGKPWQNDSGIGPRQFWDARNQWMSTWDFEGNDSALQIKNLNVYSYE